MWEGPHRGIAPSSAKGTSSIHTSYPENGWTTSRPRAMMEVAAPLDLGGSELWRSGGGARLRPLEGSGQGRVRREKFGELERTCLGTGGVQPDQNGYRVKGESVNVERSGDRRLV